MTDDRHASAPGAIRVLIAAGGTGGHVYPALAVADVLRRRGHVVAFSGGHRLEATVVPAAGYPLHELPARGLPRRPSPEAVVAGLTLVRGLARSRRLLRRLGIDVVLGLGGYDSLAPALAAGWSSRAVVLHEQNAHLALSHRLSLRRAAALALSLPLPKAPDRRGARVELTGNPLRAPIRALAEAAPGLRAQRRRDGLQRFGLADGPTTVLVTGGSLGAKAVNDAVVANASLWRGRDDLQFIHVSGRGHEDTVRQAWSSTGVAVVVEPFLEDIETAYACADLVVTRSGGSVCELTACGLPSILVPRPGDPGGHTHANASALAAAGAAVVVLETAPDLPGRLGRAVLGLIDESDRRREMARAAAAMGRPAAADAVADLVEWAARTTRARRAGPPDPGSDQAG